MSSQGLSLALSCKARRAIRTGTTISAVAAPAAPPVYNLEDENERKRLAEEYGFTQIGAPVPEGVTLKQVVDTIPKEVRGNCSA